MGFIALHILVSTLIVKMILVTFILAETTL